MQPNSNTNRKSFRGTEKELFNQLSDFLKRSAKSLQNTKNRIAHHIGIQQMVFNGSESEIQTQIGACLEDYKLSTTSAYPANTLVSPKRIIRATKGPPDLDWLMARRYGKDPETKVQPAAITRPAPTAVTNVRPATKQVSVTDVKAASKPVYATTVRPATKPASKATATPPAKPSPALVSHPAGFNLQDALQASNDYWKDNAVSFEQSTVNGSAVIKIQNRKTGLAENIPVKSFNAFATGRKIELSKVNDNGSVTLTYAGHRKLTGKNGVSMLTDGVNWPHLMQLPHMQPEETG